MTNTAYIFQEKNACHAYEYGRDGGESEESGGDRPPGPHDWYEFDYGEKIFLQLGQMWVYIQILKILLNGKRHYISF